MTINELQNKTGLLDNDIAQFFKLKNLHTFRNSSAKKRYQTALCEFYEFLKSDQNKENK